MSRWLMALMLALLVSPAAGAELKPFTADSYRQIVDQHDGQPFLLVLWSVDCPPCHEELATLGRLLRQRPDLPVTLISTDQHLPTAEVHAVLARYGVAEADNWLFADPVPSRLRQAIDPGWYGVLPRSYFFLSDGRRVSHSGLLPEAALREQLQAFAAERSGS